MFDRASQTQVVNRFLEGMPPLLAVLSHLLIRDNHNCGSRQAFFPFIFLNVYAQHSQELPNYIRSEILDVRIVVLPALVIFPHSSRWTYWIINMRSTSTDDVIRLASLRHQLCILDVCQSGVLPLPYLRHPHTPC